MGRETARLGGKPVPKKPRHNLPAQPTPFIGRAAQIAAIKELLLTPDVHLVTLIGPGGTGKTRLSLQAAQEVLEHFPNGVFFVPLADDTDAKQFVSRVAQQLEVREGGRPLLENLKDYLRDKRLLLVLDNFEQLVSAAPVAADLLAAAPRLKVLVSSRITLNLHGEHEFQVPPLELPQAASGIDCRRSGRERIRPAVRRAGAGSPSQLCLDRRKRLRGGRDLPAPGRAASGARTGCRTRSSSCRRRRSWRGWTTGSNCSPAAHAISRPGSRLSGTRWNGVTAC